MDKKIRDILTRPFDKAAIKTRKGPGNKLLQYIELQEILDRLNEAFQHDWSLNVVSREQFEDQVVVEVRLAAGGIEKTGIGGSSVRRNKNDRRLLSLADDFKMAEADAVKRAARSFGIAAELYRDADCAVSQGEASAGDQAGVRQEARISTAQIAKLRELVSELGSDFQSFRQWVRTEQGCNVEYTSRSVGAELIDDLIRRLRRKRGLNGSGPHLAVDGGRHELS